MRYCYTPVRKSTVKNSENSKCRWECRWYSQYGQQISSFLTKTWTCNCRMTIWPVIATLGIYPREMKMYVYTKNLPTTIYSGLLVKVKTWKQPRCWIVWTMKQTVIYIYHGLLFSIKKKTNFSLHWVGSFEVWGLVDSKCLWSHKETRHTLSASSVFVMFLHHWGDESFVGVAVNICSVRHSKASHYKQ